MKPKSSYVLAGTFVLLLGAALIGGILWLTTGGPPRDYDFYLVYMKESVSGLSVDAQVKYMGVDVGRVREVGLNPGNPEEVRLLLVVLEGTPIKADTVATLEVQGLTGIAHVNLSRGTAESGPLEPTPGEEYPVIQSRPSLLVRLDDTVSELLANLIETSSRVNALLDEENREAISATLANARTISGNVAGWTERLDELGRDLEAILSNVRDATGRLPELMAQIDGSALAFETMAETLADTASVVQQTGLDLQHTVAASGGDLRRFTNQALPEAGELIVELRQTARNLRLLSEEVQGDPSVLLFGPGQVEPGPGERR